MKKWRTGGRTLPASIGNVYRRSFYKIFFTTSLNICTLSYKKYPIHEYRKKERIKKYNNLKERSRSRSRRERKKKCDDTNLRCWDRDSVLSTLLERRSLRLRLWLRLRLRRDRIDDTSAQLSPALSTPTGTCCVFSADFLLQRQKFKRGGNYYNKWLERTRESNGLRWWMARRRELYQRELEVGNFLEMGDDQVIGMPQMWHTD